MPDITMCDSNNKCPVQDQCYRHMARPDKFQSYSDFYAACNSSNHHAYMMRMKKKEESEYV